MSVQDRVSSRNAHRRVAALYDRSRDLLALGGAMIGVALIVGVIVVGWHERQTSFRVVEPAETGASVPDR